MPASTRMLSALTAAAIFMATVFCSCAGASVATTAPSEPPCCQHPVDSKLADGHSRTPSHTPAEECPHCKQSAVSAAPVVPAAFNLTLAAPPWSALAPLPAVSVTAPSFAGTHLLPASFDKAVALPLRLHCAFNL